jgi:hemerythrin-like domain-containing protein
MIAPMTATAALREEHVVILQALEVLETAAVVHGDGDARGQAWAALLDWFHDFADVRHHSKEERWLFPALEVAGMPRVGGPLAVMMDEHEQGRNLLRALREASAPRRPVLARAYADMLRAHIAKENDVLFELADALLDRGSVDVLLRAYASANEEQGPDFAPDRAAVALHRLAERFAPGAARTS